MNRNQPQNLCVLGLMGCSSRRADIGSFTKEGIYCLLPLMWIFCASVSLGAAVRGEIEEGQEKVVIIFLWFDRL